ncbi:hypothetical protein HD806DRAFT_491211 [Xylariaceae sp. AK1471]|nr:hypothetical protein HD806DRAFT_491211 [Xylariaceae sp. AK1471]
MRLLHVHTLKLTDFSTQKAPKYAILSHCWRYGLNEILYEDVEYSEPQIWQNKKEQAATKVINTCAVACEFGYDYVWIDTCCIDKRSSSELSEAINSMFLWYRQAGKCFAFLDDVHGFDDLGSSRWFTRGWTLQELIAPDNVWFYNKDWAFISDRFSMVEELSAITGIDEVVLRHGHEPELVNWASHDYRDYGMGEYQCPCGINCYDSDRLRGLLDTLSIATIMSWAAKRTTSREEDTAYCLMGLFDINMPLLYGERGKAFIRLQEEIIQRTNDQSILTWVSLNEAIDWFEYRDLASSPANFLPLGIKKQWSLNDPAHGNSAVPHMNITKEGLEVDLLLYPMADGFSFTNEQESYLAVLDCTVGDNPLARPAIVIGRPPWSKNMFDRFTAVMLLKLTPDSSLSKGIAEVVVDSTAGKDPQVNLRMDEWREEIDLSTGEVRRITLARIMLRRGTHSLNRFRLPPLQIGGIADCDPGEYTVDYALPDFDKVLKTSSPSNEEYGLMLLTKEGSHKFFIMWSDGNYGYKARGFWCKVLPVDEHLTELFAAAKERGRYRRSENTGERKEALRITMEIDRVFREAQKVDKMILHFGNISREVLAEVKLQNFLGKAVVELTISVNLPPSQT